MKLSVLWNSNLIGNQINYSWWVGEEGLPWSFRTIGINANPANTVGIPMVKPEKVAEPFRWPAYALAEETMMKKVTFLSDE